MRNYRRKFLICLVCGEKIKRGKYCLKHKKLGRKIKQREYFRKWYLSNGRKWGKANPEKELAHQLVAEALRKKKLIKPKACKICKQEKPLAAHHPDYSKPLKVWWVCRKCHKQIHLSLKK